MLPHEQLIKIGTRGSTLALWQANAIARNIEAKTEICVIKTSGDTNQSISLQEQSQTGVFTREIENQLLSGKIDLAVHSLKDLPTVSPPGISVGAYLARGSVTDLLLIHPDWHSDDMLVPVKQDCIVGATSLRRQALLKLYGIQARPAILRGNVPTRVTKCLNSEVGAIIVAKAGIERLQIALEPLIAYEMNSNIWLPAPGQGCIAVQYPDDRKDLHIILERINDRVTKNAVSLERKLLAGFEGGCHTAFGAYAFPSPTGWTLLMGLEDPHRGWVRSRISGSFDSIQRLNSQDLTLSEPVHVTARHDLCEKIRL